MMDLNVWQVTATQNPEARSWRVSWRRKKSRGGRGGYRRWREEEERWSRWRRLLSSSSVIEKLVFIAPLRLGLNHRQSRNFVVSRAPTPLPVRYLPPGRGPLLSCLIFRSSTLWSTTRPFIYIFSWYRYRCGWKTKILPAFLRQCRAPFNVASRETESLGTNRKLRESRWSLFVIDTY